MIISDNDSVILNSEKILIIPDRNYRFVATVRCVRGTPYGAYLVVILLDADNREIRRRIRWINDSTGEPVKYEITFKTARPTTSVLLGCRVNSETPQKGVFELELPLEFSQAMLYEADQCAAESADILTDYVQPLYLEKISKRVDGEEFEEPDDHLDAIIKTLEEAGARSAWQKGIEPEVRHWTAYLLNNLRSSESERYRLDPALPLSREMIQYLPHNEHRELRILDVGSGPLTTVGKVWTGHAVKVIPIDPLAHIYDKLLKEAQINPPVRTVEGKAEELSRRFPQGYFDLVYCANALDHCFNPIKGLREMLYVLRAGGSILLKHFPNEAENESYQGFHQWNLWAYKGNFIVWNRHQSFVVNRMFKHHAEFTVSEDHGLITVSLRKTRIQELIGRG